MKNYIILGIAILCGLLAFALSHNHFIAREKALGLRGKKITVVVATRKIEPGEPLVAGVNVGTKDMLKDYLIRDSEGRYDVLTKADWDKEKSQAPNLTIAVERGQPIRWSYFGYSRKTGPRTFAMTVTPGKRALSLPVDQTTAVTNLIRTNDRVDIIATFAFPGTSGSNGNQQLDRVTRILLQNVKILAIGQSYSRLYRSARAARQKGYSNITVEVRAKEAEMLVFATQMGKLHFILRNPEDVDFEEDTQAVQFRYLQKSIEKYIEERKREQESSTTYRP